MKNRVKYRGTNLKINLKIGRKQRTKTLIQKGIKREVSNTRYTDGHAHSIKIQMNRHII